jgi:hypothetical protein
MGFFDLNALSKQRQGAFLILSPYRFAEGAFQ